MYRSVSLGLFLLPWALRCQPVVVPDSVYFRMTDAAAIQAMRFDMNAYRDTLRAYREALDVASMGIDASNASGEARRSRLGLLRQDLQELDDDRAVLRKRLKRQGQDRSQCAAQCGLVIARIRQFRARMAQEDIRPRR